MNAPTIYSLDPTRRRNDDAVAQLAALGLCPGPVLDITYGRGSFWAKYRPDDLTTNDLRVPGVDHAYDFTTPPPLHWLGAWQTVVFDPPYKLNGTPTDDDRYGVDEKVTVAVRMDRIQVGARYCSWLVRPGGYLWVKYQDQVANGQMYWQSDVIRDQLPGWVREARMFVAGTCRPQRSQRRARNNYSTLEVWRRPTGLEIPA